MSDCVPVLGICREGTELLECVGARGINELRIKDQGRKSVLESIRCSLPLASHFDPYLYRFIDILRATLIIHAKLHDIAILELVGFTLRSSRAETKMIEESAGGGFGVFDKEFAVVGPDLCVGA